MNQVLLYATAGSREEALTIAHDLVDDELIACANVMPGVTSVYRWEGEVQEDPEVVFIMKSRADLVPSVVKRVRALHSYDCPCVVSVPIADGNPEFLEWIGKQTGPRTES